MRGAFALGQISAEEKSDILNKHRHVYDGYRTMQPEVSNTQPLYVQDFANDKKGITVNNKGVVKPYTNMGINEQWEAAVGDALAGYATDKVIDAVTDKFKGETSEEVEKKQTCSECGGNMMEGECSECGWKGEMDEETGHLDDIYHEQDLDPNAEFDYVKGASNKTNAFHIKEQGGNTGDMDVDDVESSYSQKMKGPDQFGDDTYSDIAPDMDVDDVKKAFDFVSDGPSAGDAYPVNEIGDDFGSLSYEDNELENERDEIEEYSPMESAWADDVDEQSISGVQGVYGDMEPPYDFDSGGPGKAGPYQTREEENEDWSDMDEDLQESFINQKNKIMEMMNRMKVIK